MMSMLSDKDFDNLALSKKAKLGLFPAVIFKENSNKDSKKEVFIFNQTLEKLKAEDYKTYQIIKSLSIESNARIYQNTKSTYFKDGETFYLDYLKSLKNASKFIFLEYFIIEEGYMWDQILEILKEKKEQGVEVRVMYDDIGCIL